MSRCASSKLSLGIQADFLTPTDNGAIDKVIPSYSGFVKFEDPSVPLDEFEMTDGRLLRLAILAYREMQDIWESRNLKSEAMPGAMAAIAYGDKVFFASTLRAPKSAILIKDVHKGTVRENMEDALTMGLGPHKIGGGCSEINCIQLLWEVNGKKDPDKSTPAPRVAIWVRPRDKPFGTESSEEACTWKSNTSPGTVVMM
ncbi:MAG: hypothetical protein Q9171_004497 [Xanthocarpia ochracea]